MVYEQNRPEDAYFLPNRVSFRSRGKTGRSTEKPKVQRKAISILRRDKTHGSAPGRRQRLICCLPSMRASAASLLRRLAANAAPFCPPKVSNLSTGLFALCHGSQRTLQAGLLRTHPCQCALHHALQRGSQA